MRVQMPWFPPIGTLTGLGGTQIARQLFKAGGKRHRLEAVYLLALAWFPLFMWLIVQFSCLEK